MIPQTVVFYRVGFKIKQNMRDEDVYKDRESQMAAIEKTFVGAKEPVCSTYLAILYFKKSIDALTQ